MSKSNNKRKWEIEYEKFVNGEMDTKMQELETKVNSKTANKEEYEEFKKIQKVKENIAKVKNILELREKLQNNQKEIREEIARLDNLEKANKEQENIQKEFEKIDKERASALKQLKSKDLEAKDKADLQSKLKDLDQKLAENNKQYIDNQNVFANNKECKNKKLMGMPKEELENKQFEIGTKISKCNLVANNLMQGKSWDAIEISLDNWKGRKFTSKEKLTEKMKSNEKEEIDLNKLSNNIIKTTEKQIREEQGSQKEETALAVKSGFLEKHPRLAKMVNGIKGMWNKITKKEEKEENETKTIKGTDKNSKAVEEKDEDFKKYLREVAEKGMEQVKREKLEEAKKQAHARETQKFGKDYADRSYNMDDGQER